MLDNKEVEIKKKENEIKDLQLKLNNKVYKVEELQSILNNKKNEIKDLQSILDNKEGGIKKKENEINNLQSMLDNKEEEIKKKENEIKDLQLKFNDKVNEINISQSVLKSKEDELNNFNRLKGYIPFQLIHEDMLIYTTSSFESCNFCKISTFCGYRCGKCSIFLCINCFNKVLYKKSIHHPLLLENKNNWTCEICKIVHYKDLCFYCKLCNKTFCDKCYLI